MTTIGDMRKNGGHEKLMNRTSLNVCNERRAVSNRRRKESSNFLQKFQNFIMQKVPEEKYKIFRLIFKCVDQRLLSNGRIGPYPIDDGDNLAKSHRDDGIVAPRMLLPRCSVIRPNIDRWIAVIAYKK